MLEETQQRLSEFLSGEAFAHMTERTFQPDTFFRVIFAGRGKFVCCSTTTGVRVFETAALLESGEGAVNPVYAVDRAAALLRHGGISGYYYAVVDDPARHRILYGGLGGAVHALDLMTGETSDLLSLPGKPALMKAQVAGRLLICHCQPGFPETQGKRQPPLLQVWDLDRLTRDAADEV
jgi:hypothetical protein